MTIQSIIYRQQRHAIAKNELTIRATFDDEQWADLYNALEADNASIERKFRERLETFLKELVVGPSKD